MDRGSVRTAFEDPAEFTTSPLYRALSRTVARTGQLLDLAARGRPGQYPTFLFVGAVHLLLLRGADHPLARYYPSVAGDRALPADEADPALASFGEMSAPELDAIISTRLVQTNHVQRALALLAFDAAIRSLGVTGPLWWLSVEGAPKPDPRPQSARHGPALSLRGPDGAEHLLAVVDGHLAWIEPLRGPFRRT